MKTSYKQLKTMPISKVKIFDLAYLLLNLDKFLFFNRF